MHIMLDLETFSTRENACVVAIGAVKFDPVTNSVDDEFYAGVFPSSCQSLGLHIDASTVEWWLQPERAEARTKLLDEDRHDLPTALYGFSSWIDGLLAKENAVRAAAAKQYGKAEAIVWGNGAGFDNVILRNAYRAASMEAPWWFGNDRCYRTVKNMAPSIKLVRSGTFHCAVDDARTQAQHLLNIATLLNYHLS